ncbi:MAG: alginate lyase family protein [Bacteroidales bacterium]|nr:alginate lyase family protein [Bacteroidales bacterium]
MKTMIIRMAVPSFQNKLMKYFGFLILFGITILLSNCVNEEKDFLSQAEYVLNDSVLLKANVYLNEEPQTVTASMCPRSSGGIHDFYSEGDYWWPNPDNPEGLYVRKDGMTNPENFTEHRKALMRFSEIVGTMTSAYLITYNKAYSDAVNMHLKAWFIDDSTKMNPNLLFAQAVKGRHTGRGIGIIDAIHFMEVVQSVIVLEEHQQMNVDDLVKIKEWFSIFVDWLTTHPYGLAEMKHPNNHSVCWNMQVGLYAVFTGNEPVVKLCRDNYMYTLLPNQMAIDGSFPLELKRTKPYGYSLFVLDAMLMNCLILSDKENDLWTYTTDDGKNILKGLEYMQPYIADKASWPLDPDVMYWEFWPVAQPAYLFGAKHFERNDFFLLWKDNKHYLEMEEFNRNVPIRNPLIWISP